MSGRHKQRRLAQLRQTIEEKVNLLQRQKADFISIVNEYISEAEVSAASLLSSGNADVDVDRYLHVIRQLDRRSQICLQLTSKAYDIIDASADLESGGEEESGPGLGSGQASDSDGHPHLSASAGIREKAVDGKVHKPEEQLVSAVSRSASISSRPEADQVHVSAVPGSSAAAQPSIATTDNQASAQLLTVIPYPHIAVPPSHTSVLHSHTAVPHSFTTIPYMAVSHPGPSALHHHAAVPHHQTVSHHHTAGPHPHTAASHHHRAGPHPTTAASHHHTAGPHPTTAASQHHTAGPHPHTAASHHHTAGPHHHTAAPHSHTAVAHASMGSCPPSLGTHLSTAGTGVGTGLTHDGQVTHLTAATHSVAAYGKNVANLQTDLIHPVSSARRVSPQGAGVEPDTFWRLEIGIQHLPHDYAVPVNIIHAENPWSFYVLTSESTVKRLTQEISNYLQHSVEGLSLPRIGDLCLTKFTDDVHYRARIQKIHGQVVEVFFIDFGNTHSTLNSELLNLPDIFKDLPALAIHCGLNGVMPVSKCGLWTESAVNHFWQLVAGQQFMCRAVHEPCENPPTPTLVDLFSTAPRGAGKSEQATENISVSAILIEQKVAQPVSTSELLQLLTATCPDSLPLGAEASTYCSSSLSSDLHSSAHTGDRQMKQGSQEDRRRQPMILSPKASEFMPSRLASHTVPRLLEQTGSSSTELDVPEAADVGLTSKVGKTTSTGSQSGGKKSRSVGDRTNKADGESGQTATQQGGFSLRGNKRRTKCAVSARETASTASEKGKGVGAKQKKGEDRSSEKHIRSQDIEKCRSSLDCESQDWMSVLASLMGEASSPDKITTFSAMAAAVHSPTDFYMHRVTETTGNRLHNMMQDLNKEFEHMQKTTMEQQSQSFVAKPGGVCCARFSRDDCFYRAVVLSARAAAEDSSALSDEQEFKICVFYVDFGDKEWLPASRVFPLPLAYQYIPPQALWCSLICIKPCAKRAAHSTRRGEEETAWSAQACRTFSQLVGVDRFLTVFACTGEVPEEKFRADALQKKPLPVLLVDPEDDDLCINHELILRKLGVFTETAKVSDADGGTATDIGVRGDDEDGWDDMKKDAESLRNTYNVDVNDAGVAVTGIKEKGGSQSVCRYYNKPSSCWKGNRCPYLHVQPGSHQDMSGNLKQVLVFEEDQTELLPAEGTLVAVEVSNVRTPSHFYVTLPWGGLSISQVTSMSSEFRKHVEGETLDQLNASMAEFYKGSRIDTDYSVYAMGEAVAAYCKRTGAWLRAKVLDTDPDEEEAQVVFVDFGDKEWVSERDIRQLQKRFIHLPPQAVECCLFGIIPPQPRVAWPTQSRKKFLELVHKKTLVARVVKRMWSGRLMVELLDTSSGKDLDIGAMLVSHNMASYDTGSLAARPSVSELSQDGGGGVCYVPG